MNKQRQGFTLIELAVVLLVIGLVFASVVAGTKLLEQAKLRSIITEVEELKSAYHAFIARYDELPGDIDHASVFFTGCATGGVGNLNCNGNGDKAITFDMGNTFDGDQVGDETAKVQRHLYMANLYEKGGINPLLNIHNAHVGAVLPGYFPYSQALDKLGGYTITSVDAGNTGGSGQAAGVIYDTGTVDIISSFPELVTAVYLYNYTGNGQGILAPAQCYSIDKKIDDGRALGANAKGATSGSFRTQNDATGSGCVSGDNYLVTDEDLDCVPGFSTE